MWRINRCWKQKKESLLFKYKDDVISWLKSCIELDQAGMVQIIHDLDLILHHLLPKIQTERQIDRWWSRQRQWQTDKGMSTCTDKWESVHIHGHDERCQLFPAMRQCIVSSRSNISHLSEKYFLCSCSKWPCLTLVCTKNCYQVPALYIVSCDSHCRIKCDKTIFMTVEVALPFLSGPWLWWPLQPKWDRKSFQHICAPDQSDPWKRGRENQEKSGAAESHPCHLKWKIWATKAMVFQIFMTNHKVIFPQEEFYWWTVMLLNLLFH